MIHARRRLLTGWPQPMIATVLSLCACATLVWSYWQGSPSTDWSSWQFALAILLALLIIPAYHFPIHVNTYTKVEMVTVPIFMLTLLSPPAVAAVAVGAAIFGAETTVWSKRGLWWSDIWTAASRWVVVVALGASLAGWLIDLSVPLPLVLLIAAGWLFLGDVLTLPFVLAAMNQRRPLSMLPELAADMWRIEGAQYLLGIVAVLLLDSAAWALVLLVLPLYLVYASFRRAYELQEGTRKLLQVMADQVDRRDPLTEQHSFRVSELSRAICDELQLGRIETDVVVAAARVHDLGKIAISDAILNKPGPLTAEEWAIMMTHAEIGANMVEESLQSGKQGRRLAQIIREHHERWDGQGYPRGIAGSKIALGARIIAVADSFDVMTSDRPYRRGMSERQALATLQQDRGQQWDPAVVNAFLRTRGAGPAVAPQELTSRTVTA